MKHHAEAFQKWSRGLAFPCVVALSLVSAWVVVWPDAVASRSTQRQSALSSSQRLPLCDSVRGSAAFAVCSGDCDGCTGARAPASQSTGVPCGAPIANARSSRCDSTDSSAWRPCCNQNSASLAGNNWLTNLRA
jgi:hypothetical protein